MKNFEETVHNAIAEEITNGCRVLDLGCGDGTLLNHLISNKKIKGHGVDISSKAIINCIEKGIPVIQLDLNKLPLDFPDKSFDFVILNQTLQQILCPGDMIMEMLRIGKEAILGFPNFGVLGIRLDFLLNGKMPITYELPYRWHDTPNIHLSTINDFFEFCKVQNIEIIKKIFLKRRNKNDNFRSYRKIKYFSNTRAELGVFKIHKD